MKLYDELVARGLIAQVTNEDEIREMIDNGKATFYIGFDPTADSLHVGHFMALCLMKRLQMAGNKPIALIGGGTAMIGDPSGRTDMRSMMTQETIQHNCDCFKKQMERFIEFGEGKAQMVNNADWLLKLTMLISSVRSAAASPSTICCVPSASSREWKRACPSWNSTTCPCSPTTSTTCSRSTAAICSSAAMTSGPICWAALS